MASEESRSIPSPEEIRSALIKKQGLDVVEKLERSTVAICGLGGLGSNIAICLARSGVKKLILVDFDRVDVTNLQRQQFKASQVGMPKADALVENLREIAPYVELESHVAKVSEENALDLVREADAVCEAFDGAEAKAMLVNLVLESCPGKFLVAASGMAGFDSVNEIKTRRITKRFYLCGDERSDVDEGLGLVAPRVMTCAAHQAMTVIRLLCGME